MAGIEDDEDDDSSNSSSSSDKQEKSPLSDDNKSDEDDGDVSAGGMILTSRFSCSSTEQSPNNREALSPSDKPVEESKTVVNQDES